LNKQTWIIGLIGSIALVATISMAVPTESSEQSTHKSFYQSFFEYSATTGNIDPAGESPPITPDLIKYGEWTYRGLCIGCHGPKGDGNGAVWELADQYSPDHKLPRRPRDFEGAVFKVRSTPSGSLPTDRDLFSAISRGLVADQDMPAFKFLPERDRWAVVAYIKTLSERWEEEKDYQEDPVEIGEAPVPTGGMLRAGKDVYKEMKCAKCHGPLGKGDGPSAPELEDDDGLSIAPRDFSDPSQFVASSEPAGIYQTFTTGFDGTPMPSYADFLDEEQRWQLVWYVMSLRLDWDLDTVRARLGAGPDAESLVPAPEVESDMEQEAGQASEEAEA
jgi:cytochrome c oxidase cbb3-type subunit 2